jgi:hypothetical protein
MKDDDQIAAELMEVNKPTLTPVQREFARAEDELIKGLGLLDPPCVGGPNFNAANLWDALIIERVTRNRLQIALDKEKDEITKLQDQLWVASWPKHQTEGF